MAKMKHRFINFVLVLLLIGSFSLHGDSTESNKLPKASSAKLFLKKGFESYNKGDYLSAQKSYETGLEIAKRLKNETLQAGFLTALGLLHEGLGEHLLALKYHQQSLAIKQTLGNQYGEASSLSSIGTVYESIGKYSLALDSHQQCVVIMRELNKRREEAACLNNLGIVYMKQGQYSRALDYYQQPLKIYRELGYRAGEAASLGNLGIVYEKLNQYPRALDFHKQSLVIMRDINNRAGEAKSLNNLGTIYQRLSQYPRALDYYQQSLVIDRELKNRMGESESLDNLGIVYNDLSQYPRALDYHQQSLKIDRSFGDRAGEAASLTNLGVVTNNLGQYPRALDYYQQSLVITRELGNLEGESIILDNLGRLYNSLGQYSHAIVYHQQSLKIDRELGNRAGEAVSLGNLGNVYRNLSQYTRALDYHQQSLVIDRGLGNQAGISASFNDLGNIYANLEKHSRALEYYQKSLVISRRLDDRAGEAASLNNLGSTYKNLDQLPRALKHFQQSLAILSQIDNTGIHWVAWAGLADTYLKLKQPKVAIFAGKQAVNILQGLRSSNIALEKSQQKSYLIGKKYAYRDLADTLIEQGRLPEAEQVIEMVKEEEYFEFIQRDGDDDNRTTLSNFTTTEHSVVMKLNKSNSQLLVLGREHKILVNLSKTDESAKIQLNTLESKLDDSQAEYLALLLTLKELLQNNNQKQVLSINFEHMKNQQKLLTAINSVIIKTWITKDKLHLLLTTPDKQIARQSQIGEKELNQLIERFRKSLKHSGSDPLPLAQELYKYLVKPLENDLKQAQPTTIMWSLDGSLRYLPLSVLHDGKQYLLERYALSIYTAAAHNNLTENNVDTWHIAGLGVSLKHPGFIALPSVPQELESIVRRNKDDKDGVIEGRIYLDKDFTRKTFQDVLQEKYPVVHIASHFKLQPGNGSASTLLLGDGDTLTLDEFRRNAKFKLHGVDLLTLSACDTAVGGSSEGAEVESFAVMAQLRGAKGVMASLWKVQDESTRLLMQQLYKLRSENTHISKAEALRQAQLKLLYGRIEAKGNYSHPYFWAPFVMMGNWL